MESVHVFRRIDCQQNFLRIHLPGQRQLHQDAIDFIAAIEVVDKGQQVGRGCGLGRSMFLAVDAYFLAALDLATNINLGSRIVPHQHDGQSRPHAGFGQGLGLGRNFGPNFRCDLVAVENSGWHQSPSECIRSFSFYRKSFVHHRVTQAQTHS